MNKEEAKAWIDSNRPVSGLTEIFDHMDAMFDCVSRLLLSQAEFEKRLGAWNE